MPDTRPTHPPPGTGIPAYSPVVVLDTNVVLDWLLFRDAGCARVASLLLAGRLHWHATASMRSELSSILPRRQFQPWAPDCEHILSVFDQMAKVCAEPPSADRPTARLRCRDPDDQKFIDLAVAHQTALISKDKAILCMAKRLARLSVQVMPAFTMPLTAMA